MESLQALAQAAKILLVKDRDLEEELKMGLQQTDRTTNQTIFHMRWKSQKLGLLIV